MHLLSVFAIGIASNIDNLGIGMSYGMRSTRVPFFSNLLIALLSVIATFLSMTAGDLVSHTLQSPVANAAGGVMIIVLGLWSIRPGAFRRPAEQAAPGSTEGSVLSLLDNPEKADRNQDHILSWRESISLGLALAMNCIASGFGAGISGVSPVWTSVSVGVFSLITIELGIRIGYRLADTWIGRYANAIGGILLIGIGLYEIFV